MEARHYSLSIVSHFQTLRKQPMTVYGDGKQTRSFQYVSDLVLDLFIFPCLNVEAATSVLLFKTASMPYAFES